MRALAVLLILVTGCAKATSADPRYPHQQCQRVSLKASPDGTPIVGAEDIAYDHASRTLFVSAYDRRASEKAIARRKENVPTGNVFAVPIEAFASGISDLVVTPVLSQQSFTGGLRPHGITVDGQKLVFVNRAVLRDKKKWRKQTQLVSVNLLDGRQEISIEETHCAANDVILDGEEALFTIDHKACGGGVFWEDVFNLKRSGVLEGNTTIVDGVRFANGLAKVEEAGFAVAATRAKKILMFDGKGTPLKQIDVSGGPDNLSLSSNGDLIAALHSSLLRMGLYRKLGIGKAPSKIVAIDLETGAETLLFKDKDGDLFASATVGIEEEGLLIAGSVLDEGLLVCKAKDAKN